MASQPHALPDSDQAIWLSYAQWVKNQMSIGTLGQDDVVYISPPTFVGMGVSGRDEDVNGSVSSLANVLLSPGNGPLFSSSGAGNYFERLDILEDYVALDHGKAITADEKKLVDEADDNKQTANKNHSELLNTATNKYNDYVRREKSKMKKPNQIKALSDWLSEEGTPDLEDAKIGLTNATADWKHAYLKVYGNSAKGVIELNDNFERAKKWDVYSPGLNMPMVADSISASKTDISKDIFYTPQYGLTGYKDTLSSWRADTTPTVKYVAKLNVKQGSNLSWSQFGHTASSDTSGVAIGPVFNNVSTKNGDETDSRSGLEEYLHAIDFSLKFKQVQLFNITHGKWDRPSLRSEYVLNSGAPEVKDYVIPRVALIGYGVGLSVAFDDKARTAAHEEYKKLTKEHENGMNILGIQIRGGKDTESTTETSKDDVKFDENSGTLDVGVEKNLVPVLLGVVGRKIKL